ncbi:hypothetical protein TIFTF001_031298 [Ficus carica]|uniref:Amidase domain-containing protein n=1 Tax=Ficus carica TaxID=3494 RepID=A0AA88DWM8_FICCA|nr:hypothetical protein TIFTF001_031298 [Ficus carica]
MAEIFKTSTTYSSIMILLAFFLSLNWKFVISYQKDSKCPPKVGGCSSLECAFELFDASFFNNTKMLEIAEGARELNIPIMRANRELVAYEDGGLHYPSVLVFNPEWDTNNNDTKNLPKPIFAKRFKYPSSPTIQRPPDDEDIAFMTQATEADNLLAKGVYLGPLHGIPYGLKDIISVPQYKTTWGSTTFKNQILNIEAWVYKKLRSAGAVLVAKLVTGSLAYDDIWFGGRTRNPWNIEEFTTGSSAGPAASTSAGMVPFSIGSETAGSISYPAARCGVTALRPTFGTVGRTGVMSISESLDKLGPFCRSASDCAIILDTIRGKDPNDMSSKDIPFEDPFLVDITKLRVGYLDDADMEVVRVLAMKGVEMVPFELNYTVDSVQGILNFTMDVDMLAHFDQWQRSGYDDEYEAQDQWPTELGRARLIPAVDYVQAQRARGKLIREVEQSFRNVDAFIGNASDWEKVCVGNLVGLPLIVVPTGFKPISNFTSTYDVRRTAITTGVYAPPRKDHIVLALAMAYQSVTNHHKQRPPIDDLGTQST